jgi:hypothetical protein
MRIHGAMAASPNTCTAKNWPRRTHAIAPRNPEMERSNKPAARTSSRRRRVPGSAGESSAALTCMAASTPSLNKPSALLAVVPTMLYVPNAAAPSHRARTMVVTSPRTRWTRDCVTMTPIFATYLPSRLMRDGCSPCLEPRPDGVSSHRHHGIHQAGNTFDLIYNGSASHTVLNHHICDSTGHAKRNENSGI